MKIETTPRDDHQVRIVAEFDADTLEKFKHRAARKISGKAKVPGFRPGKAPYDVMLRVYGEEAIESEAVELMLDELYPQVLDQAAIKPSGPGKLEEIVSKNPPVFAFIVPLAAEVELGDYQSIRKDYILEPVTDEEVDQFLNRLRNSYATAEPLERAAETGDLVAVVLSANLLNPDEDQPAELLKETPVQVLAGKKDEQGDNFPFEGFYNYVVGMAANEEKTFTYTYPEDSEFEKLRGKEVEFHVTVQSVKTLKLPELNDEFAQTLGSFESVEALKNAVRHQLEHSRQDEYDREYFDTLIDQIAENAVVKYPPHQLEDEIEHVIGTIQEDLTRQHMDLETYLKSIDKDRATFVEEDVKPVAIKRLTRALIMDEFARAEKIQVGGEELKKAFDQMIVELSQTEDLRKLRGKMSTEEFVNAIATEAASRLLNQHVLERLKLIATGKADEIIEPEVEPEVEPVEPAADPTEITEPVEPVNPE